MRNGKEIGEGIAVSHPFDDPTLPHVLKRFTKGGQAMCCGKPHHVLMREFST